MSKLKCYFNLLFFIFIFYCSFPFLVFASDEYSIDSVILNLDQSLTIKVVSNINSFNPSFKVGISCDLKDYGYGYVYNQILDKTVFYSTGRWEDTPVFNLNNNDIVQLTAGFTKPPTCNNVSIKLRAVVLPNTTKYYENIFDSLIDVSILSITPTPVVTPTVLPTLDLVNITPTPLSTITPTPADTDFKNEEVSSEQELSTVITDLSKNQKENISITEFMPYPLDSSEWVELYNDNKEDVSLTNWFIDDTTDSGGTPVLINLTINGKSFKVFEIPKSLLNNTGDTVSLLDDKKNLIHSVSYKKSIKGSSIQKNLFDKKWYITKDITKGKQNVNIDTTVVRPSSSSDYSSNEQISKTESPKIDTLFNKINSPNAEVLGVSNTANILNYGTVPIYKLPKKFTIEESSKNHSYIITEDQIPDPISVILSFLEKAFW